MTTSVPLSRRTFLTIGAGVIGTAVATFAVPPGPVAARPATPAAAAVERPHRTLLGVL
jgi:hypothetical protein